MSATDGENPATGGETHVTFNVKSSSDHKFAVTVPESMTVKALKDKLSTSEYADTPPERQRLIYSGRVMKDPDAISTYKIKDGNTIHLVKSAASSQRSTAIPSQGSTSTNSSSQNNPAATGVPTNIAAGTGNDPLSSLTGARYAGFAQMPGAGMFGADGGMGAPPNPDEMLRMLENPMFQAQMNEAMNNPAVIQMMQNSPGIRDQPVLREMLNNPEMRRIMMDPNFIRTSMQMNRMFGGGGPGGSGTSTMPAPGVTDTTPQDGSNTSTNTANNANQTNQPFNPFTMFGMPGGANAANPFAAFLGQPPPTNTSGTASNTANTTTSENSQASNTQAGTENSSQHERSQEQQQQQQQQQQSQNQSLPQNPLGFLGSMLNPTVAAEGQTPEQQARNGPAAAQQIMQQNPEFMQALMDSFTRNTTGQTGQEGGGQAAPFNPFNFFGQAGLGGFSGGAPVDNRPPEEQYAGELRQLNDMGFHDFEQNIRALRRAGGSVQGAIEYLLGGN